MNHHWFLENAYVWYDTTARLRSFTVRIARSISPTCLRAAVVLISSLGTSSKILSNSCSMITTFTIKLPLAYKWNILISELPSCLAVRDGICYTVSSLIRLKRVTKNGIPFTNIKPEVKVTKKAMIVTRNLDYIFYLYCVRFASHCLDFYTWKIRAKHMTSIININRSDRAICEGYFAYNINEICPSWFSHPRLCLLG